MLLDSHQRAITYLRLSVTDRCNMRCQYCMPAAGLEWLPAANIMQDDEIVTLVADVFLPLGVTKIRLTGGEPTVRRGLPDLIERLSRLEGIEDISLTTNGILFGDQAQRYKDAGLKRINLSLDSLKPERYAEITRGGKLERALKAMDEGVRVGLDSVKINVVVIPASNDDELLDFAALSLQKPVHVRFIEMMQVGDRAFFDERAFFPVAEIERLIRERYDLLPPTKQVAGNGPAEIWRIAGAPGTVGFITPMSRNFCHSCNRTRLTADGQIKACLMRPEECDLLGLLRSGASAAQMQEMVIRSLAIKPLHHDWGANLPINRTMSQIGG